eukprot:SAG31_NODE_276_length_18650_cov_5.821842_14_plen_193_part_00
MYYIEKTDEIKCHLGDGTVVNNWDSRNTTEGNEGCSTPYGCECSGTIYYHTVDGEEWTDEMFTSIPDSFWWCIVTFTTVGYGDKYPRTSFGRIVCAATMFCGIFFLAMPLTIVGSSFSDAWDNLQTRKLKMTAHERCEASQIAPRAVRTCGYACLPHIAILAAWSPRTGRRTTRRSQHSNLIPRRTCCDPKH